MTTRSERWAAIKALIERERALLLRSPASSRYGPQVFPNAKARDDFDADMLRDLNQILEDGAD